MIEAEPSDTVRSPVKPKVLHASKINELAEQVSEVKERIQQEKGWEASTQKLIYSG